MRVTPRASGGLDLRFDEGEAELIDRLVGELCLLLEGRSVTGLDPDPLLAGLEVGGAEQPPDDPALLRLLPSAYQDPAEASRFRRLNEQGMINRKLHDAGIVHEALTAREDGDAEVTADQLPAWARTLTAIRIALASRLGLEIEDDHERLANAPATHDTMYVFDWLAAILETISAVMLGDLDDGSEQARGSETD